MLANQMNNMLAEGGVMQEGGTVDPVSGNDVPPGAMAEEVRDDIDAKLSEGEFVIPADVVRYIGLEKLMMMRDKAKAGLKRMNDIGQMGNAEEVEDAEALHSGEGEMDDEAFSSEIDSIMGEDEGDDEREYAKGGYVRKYAPGGYVGGEANKELYQDAPIRGFEMVAMTNDAGQTIYIPFINGKAQLAIPQGYKVKSSDVTTTTTGGGTTGGAGGGATFEGGGGGTDSGGGTDGGNTDGSTPGGGQGVSNNAISIGLAAMGFAESAAGKAISAITGLPASTISGIVGKGMVDAQLDALGAANAAMSNTMDGQLGTVSDQSGNITTISNQNITDAFDMATFGTTAANVSETGVSATGEADAGGPAPGTGNAADNNNAVAADAGVADGVAAADGVGADGMGVGTVGTGDSGGVGVSAGDGSGPGSGDGDGGDGGSGAASSAGDGGSAGSAGDGGSAGGWAKGGFVSKKKTKTLPKSTGLASRRK